METDNLIFLLLGGNKLNYGICEKFRKKGFRIFVVDWNQYPQIEGEQHYQIDVKDYKKIIATLKHDGVWNQVAFAYSSIDLAVPSVVYINREIGLKTMSDEALGYATSKSEMTRKWDEKGLLNRESVKMFQYSLIPFHMARNKAIIIKPDNSASSRGITILRRDSDERQCKEAYLKARKEATNGIVLVEEFVEGVEFTVEMLGDSVGNVCVYAVSQKSHTKNADNNKIAVKLLYNCISQSLLEELSEFGIACYKALEFSASLGHLEVIVNSEGLITPIEIGARSSGYIASDLVDIVSGADYLGDLIRVQSGECVVNGLHKQSMNSSAYFFYDFPDDSVVKKESTLMDYVQKNIISRYHDRSEIYVGHMFNKIDNDNGRHGYEILEGPKDILTMEYLEEREKKMLNDMIEIQNGGGKT